VQNDKTRLRLAAYLVTGIWFVALLVTGVHLSGAWTKIVTSAPLIVLVLFAAFDNWLWRITWIRHLVRRPLLVGTWNGQLTSMRPNDEGREVRHMIPIVLVIHQTYLTLSLTMMSAESKSRSIGALLQRHELDDFTVFYHYDNTPALEFRESSPRHSGGARIEVGSLMPINLTGEYWTDRRTRGHFELHKVSKKKYGSWPEATSDDRELEAV
jgi:hypothetical protein